MRELRNLVIGYGIGAAGFGSLLAIYSQTPQTTSSLIAGLILCIFTPLAVLSTVYSQILDLPKWEKRRQRLKIHVLVLWLVSQIGCVTGIAWMLRDLSKMAAYSFAMSSGIAMIVGMAFMVLARRE